MNTTKITFILMSLFLCVGNATDQITNLNKLMKSKRSKHSSFGASWSTLPSQIKEGRVYVEPQLGLMEADKIIALPGQPDAVDFDQYAGYVTVDPSGEKALFYYFTESPNNASSKPLFLWLNGGPGCSSFGNGGLLELGPFRVRSDGKTLYRNHYSWNKVANVIFLESPVGVGFSRRNKSMIYEKTGDMSTCSDTYTFLVNWFERFPHYKNRDFYLTGESYAGHYIPQLALTILHNNKNANHNFINLKGIVIGNALIDDATNNAGMYDHLWKHDLYSDETYEKIKKYCNFSAEATSLECEKSMDEADEEMGNIDILNIYAPTCLDLGHYKAEVYDPCATLYVHNYLNNKEVQKALHAIPSTWDSCRILKWQDSPSTMLPVIQKLISQNITIWIYSGDFDGRVPVTATKYAINTMKLSIKTPWRSWYSNDQVGGYVVGYDGLVFVTVRGAGHAVPSYQPQRALTMISSFVNGTLPPVFSVHI